VKTVFIDGLPASWDEDRVRVLLKKYGEIEKIELARNMPSARRKDFGFVTFDTHDAAVACAKSINNVELGEGDNKVCHLFGANYVLNLLHQCFCMFWRGCILHFIMVVISQFRLKLGPAYQDPSKGEKENMQVVVISNLGMELVELSGVHGFVLCSIATLLVLPQSEELQLVLPQSV
jgi:RNA recognition motif-containing protein